MTVYDKLTYAGNLANLASVADDPRYTFVRGDICDATLLDEVLPGSRPGDQLRRRDPRRPVDLRRRRLRGHQRARRADAVRRLPAGRHRAGRPHRHRRGLRLDRRRLVDRGPPAAAQLAVQRRQGVGRAARPGLLRHLRPQRLDDPLQQQLRAVPVPGEADPAVRHQPDGRQEGALCTAMASTSATGCTSTTTAAASRSSPRRASRGRATTSAAASSSTTRSWSTGCSRPAAPTGTASSTSRTARATTAATPSTTRRIRDLGYAPQHTARGRAGRDGRLVPRQRGLVAAAEGRRRPVTLALLITGCKGQLGSELVRQAARAKDIPFARGIDLPEVDLTDPFATRDTVEEWARVVRSDSPEPQAGRPQPGGVHRRRQGRGGRGDRLRRQRRGPRCPRRRLPASSAPG